MVKHSMIWGDILRVGSLVYLAAYGTMQASGLFGPPPSGIMKLVQQWPFLAGVIVLMVGSVMELTTAGKERAVTARRPLAGVLLYGGLLVAGTGVLVSSGTRFEGSITLAEGQEGRVARGEIDPSSFSAGRFSSWPEANLAILNVSPFFSEKGTPNAGKQAVLLWKDRRTPGGREVSITSLKPRMIGGSFSWIAQAGYSPHCQLFNANGNLIDDGYAVLDLYPPGSEDFFRLPELPHTYYVRYYPDASMVRESDAPAGRTGPLYRVRVVRNLDLVADVYVSPNELVPFDDHALMLLDVRRWVEIRIVNDPGLFLLVPGVALAVAGAVIMAVGRARRGRKEQDVSGAHA